MEMGTRRRRQRQQGLWISQSELAQGPEHPFYERMNEILGRASFGGFAKQQCAKFDAEKNGRPSLAPGMYFPLLLVGQFEGIDSERAIAWPAAVGVRSAAPADAARPSTETAHTASAKIGITPSQSTYQTPSVS